MGAKAPAAAWALVQRPPGVHVNLRFQCLALRPTYAIAPQKAVTNHSRKCTTQEQPFSTSRPAQSNPASASSTAPENPPLNPRWLSDFKSRLGKCIFFGLTPSQTSEAGSILSILSTTWQRLLAGSEGFLTASDRAGLVDHRIVWGEMDSMGHINNVMYNRYAESARLEWAKHFAYRVGVNGGAEGAKVEKADMEKRRRDWMELWTPRGEGLILRSIRTDYKLPMTWPDRISVYHKLRAAPTGQTDSFILDVIILSHKHQRPAARCIEDIVVYDYRVGKKTNLRPFMSEAFLQAWDLQEKEKTWCLERIGELEKRVRNLETESWDRKDAKEDFGTR